MTHTAPRGPSLEEQSLGDLVATASREMSLLVHKEIELAKSEVRFEAKRAGIGAGLLGGAGFLGLLALIFLSATVALAISEGFDIPFWVGFLVVGLLYGALAAVLGLLGVTRLSKVSPPKRTIQTVKDDLTWAKHPTVAPNRQLEELRARNSG